MFSKQEKFDDNANSSLERETAARAAAEAASRMKDEFLATISHELRTPLTAILLWSRILRDGKISEKDRREAVETIERSALAQAEMIEDLLDISRMMSGKVRLNKRRLELTPLIQAAIRAAQPMADAKGVAVNSDFDAGVASVQADPVRIQQVVWNLLTNAIRSTPARGTVTVALKRFDGHVRIAVIDTGKGITPDALQHVFSGTANDSSGSRKQSGLGLVLARQLVELHGGTITAESSGEGAGATFTVEFPVESPSAETPTARRSKPKTGSVAPSEMLRGVRVTLVEDEADTRNVIRWILEQAGAEVQAVDSAAKALQLLKKSEGTESEVLVSDIGMSGEDGNDLIRKIRALDARENSAARIPAIAITAYAGDIDRRRALRAGYTAFLPKPIEADELILLIASLAARCKSSITRPES